MIGLKTGKIVSYASRSKTCRKCSYARRTGKKIKHDCRLNHSGSAKSMEPDMAVELFTRNKLFEKANVFGAVMVMDDDSTAKANVEKASEHEIIKWSDKNHTVKNFRKGLYNLKLDENLLTYFSNKFSTAIEINKNNEEGLKASLSCLVPHAFGDHSKCTFHDVTKNYIYIRIFHMESHLKIVQQEFL